MIDVNLPITGKDVRLSLIVDGAPIAVNDQITEFDAKPVYDEVQTKHIGVAWSSIDKIPTHWEGSFKITHNSSAMDDIVDEINAKRVARIPMLINVYVTYHYRNGTSRTYGYIDCKLEFDSSGSRGDAVSSTVSWKSGNDRITVQ